MRGATLFWLSLLVITASCEHATKLASSPVALATAPLADDTLAKTAPAMGPSQPASAANAAPARQNHVDSLRIVAVLAQADTTVELENYSDGDLNGDGRWDYLVLARSKQSSPGYADAERSNYTRKVFIILDAGATGLRVAAVNENLVGCTDCGGAGVGDPLQNFEAFDLGFSVTQLFGACDKTQYISEFTYNSARHNWFLKSRDESSYSCNDTTNTVNETHTDPRDFGQVRFAEASE